MAIAQAEPGTTAANLAFIQVENVTKVFGFARRPAANALGGVSLTVDGKTRLGIVGQSGSGKSTLARVIVGLEAPTTGRVTFRGQDVGAMRPADRRDFRRAVQLIAQDHASSFDPRRTLRDAVRRPAQLLLGVDRARADELVDETLALVGLPQELAERRPHEVSGGQRQRFSIARSLIVRPGIVICDEVVSALDVSVQGLVLNTLKQYCAASGAGLLFVSHGLPATAFVAETIIVMKDGVVVDRGSTAEVLHHSDHPYTQLLVRAHRGPVRPARWMDHRVDVTEGTA
jgi:peptide/nickel transport system ATP-binding protein